MIAMPTLPALSHMDRFWTAPNQKDGFITANDERWTAIVACSRSVTTENAPFSLFKTSFTNSSFLSSGSPIPGVIDRPWPSSLTQEVGWMKHHGGLHAG